MHIAALDQADPPVGPAERLDVSLGLRLAAKRKQPAVKAAAKAGKLGDQEPLYLFSAALTVAGLALRDRRLAGAGLTVGLAVAAADLAKSALKKAVTRSRPHVLMDEERYERRLGGSRHKPLQSFPSGHVAGAVAAALSLARAYPGSLAWSLPACAGLAWSRMSKAAHWPSDVAAGALAGVAVEAFTAGLVIQVRRRLSL